MELQPLSLKHKDILEQYLCQSRHALCAYAFENIYVWRCLFDIRLSLQKDKLCIFFKDAGGCFMALPPLGGLDDETVRACFDEMDSFNHNPDISRIENIEEQDLDFFKRDGFRIFEKSKDYIVARQLIARLNTRKYKSKRALYNYFTKHYQCRFRDYQNADRDEVIRLYEQWMDNRFEKNSDEIYRALLKDSLKVLTQTLEDYDHLRLSAKIVESDGNIIAFTCGFPVGKDIFCISFEFADIAFKGLPQFIFSAFAKSLEGYDFINMMDDSGIENIRWTKMSFHPVSEPVSYTALLA